MTAPLTPRERVDEWVREWNLWDEYVCVHGCPPEVAEHAPPSMQDRCYELAAELEEANERAQKWAEEAGRYAALTDFWRKRALADERYRLYEPGWQDVPVVTEE